jgi:hypothetical protein
LQFDRRMRITTTLTFIAALTLGSFAYAETASPIKMGDISGSAGKWQEAKSTIAAPIADVRIWMTDFAHWPERFADVTSAKILAQSDGITTLRFHSKIIGRDMTIKLRAGGNMVTYDGFGKDVTTQGKIFMRPIDASHTEVTLQSSSEVHGALGAFATKGLKRKRALAKMQSDLRALQAMAASGETRL